MEHYQVFDTKTQTAVGKPYANKQTARNRRDKLDTAYGAVRYVVRPVFVA